MSYAKYLFVLIKIELFMNFAVIVKVKVHV